MLNDYSAKDLMIKQMVDDFGLELLAYSHVSNIPEWLYDICDKLIRAGWRKNEYKSI